MTVGFLFHKPTAVAFQPASGDQRSKGSATLGSGPPNHTTTKMQACAFLKRKAEDPWHNPSLGLRRRKGCPEVPEAGVPRRDLQQETTGSLSETTSALQPGKREIKSPWESLGASESFWEPLGGWKT